MVPKSRPKKSKRRAGRPTKFSPELGDSLVEAIRGGATIQEACRAARLHVATFCRWVQSGERADPAFANFAKQVMEAKTDRIVLLEELVVRASRQDWRAGFELLKVYDPKRFASKVRVTIEQELTDFLKRLKTLLPAQIYEQILSAYAEGTGGEGAGGDSSEEAAATGGAGGEAVLAVPGPPGPEDIP